MSSFLAAGVLSLLPESAFCSLRGTCKGGYGDRWGWGNGAHGPPPNYGQHQSNYAAYVNKWKNQRIDDYEYYYDEDIENMDGTVAKKSKREAESESDVENSDYYNDASFLPAEHRQLGPQRPRRRSVM